MIERVQEDQYCVTQRIDKIFLVIIPVVSIVFPFLFIYSPIATAVNNVLFFNMLWAYPVLIYYMIDMIIEKRTIIDFNENSVTVNRKLIFLNLKPREILLSDIKHLISYRDFSTKFDISYKSISDKKLYSLLRTKAKILESEIWTDFV